MAEGLVSHSFPKLGIWGASTKRAYEIDDQGMFVATAHNAFVDLYGRISSRKGWEKVNTYTITSASIRAMIEYVKLSGATELVWAADTNIYKGDGSTGTPTTLYNNAAVTDDYWSMTNFNGSLYMFQEGHEPLVYNGTTCETILESVEEWSAGRITSLGDVIAPIANNGYYYECVAVSGSLPYTTAAVTEPTWPTTVGNTVVDNEVTWMCYEIPKADIGLSAFGRLWAARTADDKATVWFSDTLRGDKWGGGLSGALDLYAVWSNRGDEITALAEFSNYLVVFGKHHTVLYSGASDPAQMVVADVLEGVGCVARDSIQKIGNDIVFLSSDGIRSLARSIQGGALPLSELTKEVRDVYISFVQEEDPKKIKSAYSQVDGLYILSLPTLQRSFVFDIRTMLEGSTFPVFSWSIYPTALASTVDSVLYMAFPDSIGTYSGYTDNGSAYQMEVETLWIMSQQMNKQKIPKSLIIYGGGQGTLVVRWGFDYFYPEFSTVVPIDIATDFEYDTTAEFGEDPFYSFYVPQKVFMKGTGVILKIGLSISVENKVAISRMDLLTKIGNMK